MTLSDVDIGKEIEAKNLITNTSPGRLVGACYELRMGNVYYDLTEGGKRFALTADQSALIKPGHRVVLITAEELNVPTDILVRVVSKGSLFSVGLTAVSTYADPGFSGNLGIVTQNVSEKFIELPQGEPIAKADFTRLTTTTAHPYQGQHGFQLGIWPIKTFLQKDYVEVANDPRVGSERDEAFALLPLPTRTAIRRIEQTQFWTLVAVFIAILMNSAFLFLVQGKIVDLFYGIIGNLITSGLLGLFTVLGNRWRKIR